MFIGINGILKAYPHINNKDLRMVLEIHKPNVYEEYKEINGKQRLCKMYLITDIEKIFGEIIKSNS